MANIPSDGTRKSLLSTKVGNNKPQKYINFGNLGFSDIYSSMLRVHNREVYLFIYGKNASTNSGYFRLFKFNPLTQITTKIWETGYSSSIGEPLDFIIDDNNKMYISAPSKSFLRVYDLNTSQTTTWNFPSSQSETCFGKMEWIDNNHFIMLTNALNMLIFNVLTSEIETRSLSGGQASGADYCIGKKYIFTTSTKYDIEANVASRYVLPNGNEPRCVAYDNGRYYFSRTNELYYYDENTDTWSDLYSVGWSTPYCFAVTDNLCYAMNENSTRAYMYDLNNESVHSFIMPWKVPSLSTSHMTRGCMFRGNWMIARNTLCYISYDANIKHNAGPIENKTRVLYNTTTKDDFTYDERFIEFFDTYVTIKDGVIEYPIDTVDTDRNIYSISISKNDYNVFKNLIILTNEQE